MAILNDAMINALFMKLDRYELLAAQEKAFLSGTVSRVLDYLPGQDIVHEGAQPDESTVILSGFAGRFKLLAEGKRQILAFHIPGDFCDLHSFLLARMDHGIEALSKCVVAKLPHGALVEILKRFPRLTRTLWWDTAVDAAIHREWMVSMGRRSAYEQIAHLLCEMHMRLGFVGLVEADSFELRVNQEQLGDAFGLSAVHVNRMLQALRRANLIISSGRRITIPDVDALREAAGFDPAYLEAKARGED